MRARRAWRWSLPCPTEGLSRAWGSRAASPSSWAAAYHGKSTLLKALELGVYNHIAGDGREYVITDDTAVKIRAEDGRAVSHVDISPFINHLPNGKDTVDFSTEDASGSTSQAANVVEAVEAGAGALLMDEDTSATNSWCGTPSCSRSSPGSRSPSRRSSSRPGSCMERRGSL